MPRKQEAKPGQHLSQSYTRPLHLLPGNSKRGTGEEPPSQASHAQDKRVQESRILNSVLGRIFFFFCKREGWGRVSCSPGWAQIHYVVKDNLEL